MREASLDLAIKEAGGVNALARSLGITSAAISQWDRAPAKQIIKIERITGVPRHVLRPELYQGWASIDEAIAFVKAAGYHVSKPKNPEPKKRVGPTFVAEFADGTVTRMSTFTSLNKLDWSRGEYMARHAWASRRKAPPDWDSAKLAEAAPPIIACRFEQNGKVLAQRNGAGGASCP